MHLEGLWGFRSILFLSIWVLLVDVFEHSDTISSKNITNLVQSGKKAQLCVFKPVTSQPACLSRGNLFGCPFFILKLCRYFFVILKEHRKEPMSLHKMV